MSHYFSEMDLQNRLDPYIESKWAVYWSLLLLSQRYSIHTISDLLLKLIDRGFINPNSELPKRIQKGFIQIKPSAFEAPSVPPTLLGFHHVISGLTWHAQNHGLIDEEEENINKFIFYTIKYHSLTKTEESVKSLPSSYRFSGDTSALPHPLNLIMLFYRGDQRSSLASMGFMD